MTGEEKYLRAIADELHKMNRVLERIAQAPIFSKNENKIEEDIVELYYNIPQEKQTL